MKVYRPYRGVCNSPSIPILPAIGTVIAKGVALTGAVIVGLVLGDAASEIINGESQEESENQKAEGVKQQLASNAQAVASSPTPAIRHSHSWMPFLF